MHLSFLVSYYYPGHLRETLATGNIVDLENEERVVSILSEPVQQAEDPEPATMRTRVRIEDL